MTADPRAVALIPLRGPLAMQGEETARGLELWSRLEDVELLLVDDPSPRSVTEVYHGWLRDESRDVVLGPYGSGLVRRTLPALSQAGKVLWNHGGSADDLARPGIVQMAAPASTYLAGAVRLCGRTGVEQLVVVTGRGPFAAFVAKGALGEARSIGIEAEIITEVGALPEVHGKLAILVNAGFEDDVALVGRIRAEDRQPALLGCVAAGVPQFGERLGHGAEGVVGPTQWIADPDEPEVGPSGIRFRRLYEDAYGRTPGYVAAQAAAAGFLGVHAHRLGLGRREILAWTTSTLLGDFALDDDWRQIGQTVRTVRWQRGRMESLPSHPDPSG